MLQNREVTSLVPVCRFQAHGTYITRVLLSPDVRHLATCSADHTARIWAVDLNHSHAGSMSESMATDSSAGSGVISPGTSNTLAARNNSTSDTQPLDKQVGLNGTITGPDLAINRAVGSQNLISNGTMNGNGAGPESDAFPLETTLGGHQRWVWDCAFSADSAYLVTACSDHYARLWELSSQSIIRQYNGHHRGAVCVALNDTALG